MISLPRSGSHIQTQATLEKGTSFGAPSVHENTLAKMVIDAVPSVEMVRFTNSGTEVNKELLRQESTNDNVPKAYRKFA